MISKKCTGFPILFYITWSSFFASHVAKFDTDCIFLLVELYGIYEFASIASYYFAFNSSKLALYVFSLLLFSKKETRFQNRAGVEIKEFFLTGHKFTNLLRSVSWTWFTPRGKFWPFSLQDRQKMVFPCLKGKLNLLEKKIKKKLTLKNASKVVHFTYFLLHECSMYSHFEFELKK